MCSFRVRSIVTLVILCSLGCGLAQRDVHVTAIAASDASDARLWLITRGEIDGQFGFVVFEGGPRTETGLKSAVETTHNANGNNRTTVKLTRPDGTIVTLPGPIRIVEIIDGEYKDSCDGVSLETLDAFVAAKPAAFTIEGLLRFGAATRTAD
jgi:hypothetical protein